MGTLYWIGATGAQSWATTSNWSTGAIPVNGDDVYILAGSSDITSGLNQSAVALNSLTIGSGFTGTIGVAGDNGAYLQIATATLLCIPASSSTGLLSGGFTRFKWDAGAVTNYTAVVSATGSAADTGRGALQIKGGTASSKLYVTNGSVDVAAKPGETGTLTELDVSGGTVVCGSGLTCPTITQSAGTLTVNGAVTTLTQLAGSLFTFGTGLLGTVKINGNALFNHRPSGDAFTNLTIDAKGKADFSTDPRLVKFTNAPQLYQGATVIAFSSAQLKLTGPANLQLALKDCGVDDVSLRLGSNITLTIA
jgi:hypothetical protein